MTLPSNLGCPFPRLGPLDTVMTYHGHFEPCTRLHLHTPYLHELHQSAGDREVCKWKLVQY